MTQTRDKPTEQRLTHSGMNWGQFKLLQESFANSPGIRLFYYRGEVEILAVSQDHEIFSGVIALLMGAYFLEKEIEFIPTGSFTQEKDGEASAQADQSYLIGKTSGAIADLSIEVVFSSGNERKLPRYQALGVPEVWFWEDGVFALYHLRSNGYEKIQKSEVLPDLDINLLSRCLLMNSKIEAMREFRQGLLS